MGYQLSGFIFWLNIFGLLAFAASGALAACNKKMDILGVIVLAEVTAFGGGTLRDSLLGNYPIFWTKDLVYIILPAAMALATFMFRNFFQRQRRALLYADAVGLAVFTVVGINISLVLGFSTAISVIMGAITGTVGGLLRDVLEGEVPVVLKKELYATVSFIGGISYVFSQMVFSGDSLPMALSIAIMLVVRIIAIEKHLNLPHPGELRFKPFRRQ